MSHTIILTGDVNLMNVDDPAVPFARVADTLRRADTAFANLECCLYQAPTGHSVANEGFYAAPAAGRALTLAGFHAVGIANNVNYGADAIRSSVSELDRLALAHTGAGADRARARAPAIVARNGLKCAFVQRTSVYWPTDHEATDHTPGVAALRGHTAYQLPLHKTRPEIPPANRPGVPPVIVTWADAGYLAQYRDELAALRREVDVLVASHHWGLHEEVLDYMREIAHAAIDAGADIVVGHGPHFSLPVEIYKDKPIYYGLGSFSFHTGHGGRKHGDWVGMMAQVTLEGRRVERAAFRFVRHNDRNETVVRPMRDEHEMVEKIGRRSAPFRTRIEIEGDEAVLHAVS